MSATRTSQTGGGLRSSIGGRVLSGAGFGPVQAGVVASFRSASGARDPRSGPLVAGSGPKPPLAASASPPDPHAAPELTRRNVAAVGFALALARAAAVLPTGSLRRVAAGRCPLGRRAVLRLRHGGPAVQWNLPGCREPAAAGPPLVRPGRLLWRQPPPPTPRSRERGLLDMRGRRAQAGGVPKRGRPAAAPDRSPAASGGP